jgi:hypothetical protein
LFEKLDVEALRNLEDAREKMLETASEKTDAEGWHPGSREPIEIG